MRSVILTREILDLRDRIDALDVNQRDILLDLVDPQPEPQVAEKAAAKKRLSEVVMRKIEKCDACNYTRRAAVHKDVNADGYHEFQPPKSSSAKGEKKSARAADMAATLNRNLAQQRQTDNAKCTYASDGKVCLGAEGDAIHDKSMGYAGYHEFTALSAQAVGAGD